MSNGSLFLSTDRCLLHLKVVINKLSNVCVHVFELIYLMQSFKVPGSKTTPIVLYFPHKPTYLEIRAPIDIAIF